MSGLTAPLSLPALVVAGFLVSLATVAVPGPITLVASRLALSRHISSAIWFLVGVTTLDVTLFTALAAGAAPVLREIGALPVVELAGGIALLWGGITSLRTAPSADGRRPALDGIEQRKALGSFLLGLVVAAANPHYWIWWVTAGLAFVEAARAHGAPGLAWMLGALVGGVVAWYVPLLWAFAHGSKLLPARAEALVIRAMGIVLVALGAGLAGLGGWRFYAAYL